MSPRERLIAALVRKSDKMYAAYFKRQIVLGQAIRDQRALLKGCTHSLTESYPWEHDNGYGRQSKQEGLLCRICGKKNPWPTISGSWT